MVHTIPRSREVGQSYVTSVGTTLYSLWFSAALVLRERPELVRALQHEALNFCGTHASLEALKEGATATACQCPHPVPYGARMWVLYMPQHSTACPSFSRSILADVPNMCVCCAGASEWAGDVHTAVRRSVCVQVGSQRSMRMGSAGRPPHVRLAQSQCLQLMCIQSVSMPAPEPHGCTGREGGGGARARTPLHARDHACGPP